jgi:2-polyprenyl-6-methoxyphenol hydroxylase-like FAD-dependent oxidoreductase
MRSHLHRQPIRTTGDRSPGPTSRAVVLGASLAGLLSARVLAEHVDEVVVVDRDDLDADLDAPRRGVPQGKHTHGLLVRGVDAIETILPGFTRELVSRGALQADVLSRSRWLMGGNLLTRGPSGLVGLLASRTLVESQVRRQVRQVPEVRLLGRHDIDGLLASPDRSRVTGVRITARLDPAAPAAAGAPEIVELLADLVVDATGRGSRAPVWLRELGYTSPPEVEVDAQVVYMTRQFESRPGVLDDLDADIVGTRPPSGRAGVALRQEGGRWTVTLAGQRGEQPPADLEGYLAFAQSLPTDGIARIVAGCTPVGEAISYRYPSSRWRRWEKLKTRPQGLVMIGDAVCSFNPIYGQGMSSAAHQALRLREVLAAGTADLAGRTAVAFATVASTPWELATGADRRFPGMPSKPLPERILDRYLDRLLEVATADHEVTVAFGRVLNLVAAPPSLLAPAIAWRVLGPSSGAVVRQARQERARRLAPSGPASLARTALPAG